MSTASRSQRRRLSNILVDQGVVSKENVQEALHIQSTTGEALGSILVGMECLTPDDIAKVICVHYQLPFIGLTNYEFDSKLVQLFPAEFLHQHIILPFDRVGQMLLCAGSVGAMQSVVSRKRPRRNGHPDCWPEDRTFEMFQLPRKPRRRPPPAVVLMI